MDIEWGSEASRKFATNVGLITSNGPHGPNIMSAEWTHHISYSPGIVMVNISTHNKVTAANIEKTREFGVNIAAEDQNSISSVAGLNSGKDTDKIKVLKDLGVKFYDAKKIDVPMVDGAALNIECKLIKSEKMGSHTMFIGEAMNVIIGKKNPLVLNGGKYWKLEKNIPKPDEKTIKKINKTVKKHAKSY